MSEATNTRIGTELGPYRIESLLGRTAMSVVYLAEHVRLGRRVALKVLDVHVGADPSFRERFTRESRLAASLDHPHIVPVYDAGEAAGLFYIAMRYVEGGDLRSVMERDGIPRVAETLFIVEQVADALDAAHALGLVHRDVKPGNVLLSRNRDHAYLSDFGIVKQSTMTALTRTGGFVGTPEYAAPEQIEGQKVDARTDVYGLGCMVFECLTGQTPFQGESEMSLLYAHLQKPAPHVTSRRDDLPPALNTVLATALAKSPDERYRTCGELAAAVHAAAVRRTTPTGQLTAAAPPPPSAPVPERGGTVADEPPIVPPPTAPAQTSQPRPPGRRSSLLLTAIVALIAAALAGGAVYLFAGDDSSHGSPGVSSDAAKATTSGPPASTAEARNEGAAPTDSAMAMSEPAGSEPAGGDTMASEPAGSEPASSEPADSEPTMSGHEHETSTTPAAPRDDLTPEQNELVALVPPDIRKACTGGEPFSPLSMASLQCDTVFDDHEVRIKVDRFDRVDNAIAVYRQKVEPGLERVHLKHDWQSNAGDCRFSRWRGERNWYRDAATTIAGRKACFLAPPTDEACAAFAHTCAVVWFTGGTNLLIRASGLKHAVLFTWFNNHAHVFE